MACQDCLKNCDPVASDQCVYVTTDIPLLGICKGDPLSDFEAAIVDRLTTVMDGTGITLSDLTIDCTFLTDILGVLPPTLSNLLQMLITASCTLKELVDTINTEIANNPSFDAGCLTLGANPTRDDILQATVTLLCSIKTTVDAIPGTYVAITDLTSLVTTIVNNIIGTGSTPTFSQRMIPYVAYEYYGPMSNFDANGIGQTSLGFNKVYICNGANGTPDKRGRVATGAVRDVPGGGTLDPAVDPTNPNNPNWAVSDKAGENKHTLTVNELPSHSHAVTDPGHSHFFTFNLDQGGTRFGSNWMKNDGNSASKSTQSATTGITIAATGSGLAHNNIQPTIAANYIMYIP